MVQLQESEMEMRMVFSSRRVLLLSTAIICAQIVGCGGEKNKSDEPTETKATNSSALPEPTAAQTTPAARPPRDSFSQPPTKKVVTPPEDKRTYRMSDNRVVQNAERWKGSNIQRFESKRLILYTDYNADLAKALPAMADALFDQLTRHFGPLPDNREGTEFQATGYLMSNQQQFRTRGLLTDRVPAFENGRHIDFEFWANAQAEDYYTRHLVLHEFTHCFMACVTGTVDAPRAWYMEGMAEYFGTHRLTGAGPAFGIMPENKSDYRGLGRITYINQAFARDEFRSMRDITLQEPEDLGLYSWSWAACWFLTNHPDYGEEFRKIGTHLTAAEFATRLTAIMNSNEDLLEARWYEFVNQLCDGYDLQRAAIAIAPGQELNVGGSGTITIAANRGWQSTGVALELAGSYRVEATGRFQVDNKPKPWLSEPDGVSVRYVRGERIGCLLATVYDSEDATSFANARKIGSAANIIDINSAGVLYLRVNDQMNSLANNSGELTVTVTRTK